jgi:hypothetical protein
MSSLFSKELVLVSRLGSAAEPFPRGASFVID